ncbi:MAG: hypothetical protein QOJ26_1494 [Thermoplasmata archaeon]|nr:hypothetical protein [Thermoplasmata archaeon]
MRAAPVALLAVFLLAGCSGSQPAADADGTGEGMATHDGHEGAAAGTHLLAPTWKVGDYWTLSSPQGGEFTHAVSGESGDDWVMDTDSPDIAFFDARLDISFLGKVRKSDLAGSQGSQRVEFLRFPLQSNMTWSTSWDGAPTMIHVGKVADGKAQVKAMRADGSTYAEYTYSDSAGYFSRFVFYAPDGTTVGYEWTLQSSGSGFTKPLVRYSLATLFTTTGPIPTGRATNFQVEPGFTDVYVEGALDCTAGAVTAAVGPMTGPAENRGYTAAGPCPLQKVDSYALTAPTASEQWGAFVNGAPTTAGTLELTVFGRILTQFAAGQAPPA